MQTEVARRIERVITVSENSFAGHPPRPQGRPPSACTSCRWASTRSCSGRCPPWPRAPGHLITTASADVAMKGLSFLLEALAKLRTERDDLHLTVIGRKKEGGKSDDDDRPARAHRPRRVRHRRDRRAHRRALRRGRAGRGPVALRGLLAAGHRGHVVRRPAGGHHRWRPARGRRRRRRDRPAGRARRRRGAGRQASARRSTTPPLASPGRRRRPRAGHRTSGAGDTPPSGTVEQYRALLGDLPGAA